MMKRFRVDDTSQVKEAVGSAAVSTPGQPPGGGVGGVPLALYRQSLAPNSFSGPATPLTTNPTSTPVKVISEGMQSRLYPAGTPVSYGAMPAKAPANLPQVAPAQAPPINQDAPQQSPANFQRLKVEDALTYLDQVKFKFGSKPQVYNDFLDIMKEFKSQSIDTPGVIQRVSNLFKGFPELIVGFNTFLPPGYKIEVQQSDQGYAFQVSVSMPSPTGGTITSNSQPQRSAMILKGAGTINMAGGGAPAVVTTPAVTPSVAPAAPPAPVQPPIPVNTHAAPVAAPQAPLATPVVHHSTSCNALSLTAAQAAVALQGHTDTPQNQPVEFNHAINYVNKIKNRFLGQPEKYKKFLEILHTYQKEQRTLKESSNVGVNAKHLTEQEVYSQVAKLFENQNDLLAEFGQFLPDATSHINQAPISDYSMHVKKPPAKSYRASGEHILERHISHKQSHVSGSVKRSPTYPSYHRDAPPAKKHKISTTFRDVSLAEAGKYGSLHDFAFFDKVRKAVRNQEVYENFLRCLSLYNKDIVSKSELIQLVTPFLSKNPELLRYFKGFTGQSDTESIPYNVVRSERPQGDHALEIDLATAKRLGASYCIIPKAQEGLRCSGRTQLCREVLNDQWVSFPTWSEDSTFVSSRKTQYEEYMYRCEDERFELDVVIETNASTIRVLEGVNKKLNRMNQEELSKYKLDDCLGGTSPTLHQRALKRIYGDKAQDIIDGLKRNPSVAVPVVLRRLKNKEEEWREAQKGFNKIWREQNEKYYLKSLDHQGINFKQTDVKALRSKSLYNEIETLFDERHDQNMEGSEQAMLGPHLVLPYKDRTILDDAANLLIHHIKRQTGTQKGEKRRIKSLLKQFLPDLFFHPRQPLSDDEREDDEDRDEDTCPYNSPTEKSKSTSSEGKSPNRDFGEPMEVKMEPEGGGILREEPLSHLDKEDAYTLFMANNNWYIFLRLHAILCDRLAKIYERACLLAVEESKNSSSRKDSTAIALRLKPKPQIEIEDYYPAFLDMVKNLLDGNMDSNTYEDTLREMFGIHAYIAFTLDKVVFYAVRQLQHCVTERTAVACTELFLKEQKRGAAGGQCNTANRRAHLELQYQRAGEKAVQDENCFKIFIYKKDCRMTVELLDTEPEDPKKVDEAKKWSSYKETYSNCTRSDEVKARSPVYLNRNMRLFKRKNNKRLFVEIKVEDDGSNEATTRRLDSEQSQDFSLLDAFERKINERQALERAQADHPGYEVSDETQCKFNADSKIMFTVNKDSCLYKKSAFYRARKSHPSITKYKAGRFRAWLKQWVGVNVSDLQSKLCTDWMMGRGEGVVPTRTRVLTDNDLTRTPYVPYNRYRVERLNHAPQDDAH